MTRPNDYIIREPKPPNFQRTGPRIVVPTELLAQEIERHIPRLQAEANRSNIMMQAQKTSPTKRGIHRKTVRDETVETESAWRMLVGRRMIELLNQSEENCVRRLYSVMYREFKTTRVEIADAMLLAMGIMIEDTDLPHVPATRVAARAMVEDKLYVEGRRLSRKSIQKYADELYSGAKELVEAVTVYPHRARQTDGTTSWAGKKEAA